MSKLVVERGREQKHFNWADHVTIKPKILAGKNSFVLAQLVRGQLWGIGDAIGLQWVRKLLPDVE